MFVICVYVCVCVRICVCICDFGSKNDKSEICVFVICVCDFGPKNDKSDFGPSMTGQGPWGLDGVGLGWKKNPFIKRARFKSRGRPTGRVKFRHRITCRESDSLPFLVANIQSIGMSITLNYLKEPRSIL